MNQPNERRSILQRIVILLGIALGIFIYAYGWLVTEIDLERPQEAQRQENVTIALRELLSPRIFQQEREVNLITAPFLVGCDQADSPDPATATPDQPTLILSPTCGDSGDEITFEVVNAQPNSDARIRWMPPPNDDETSDDVRPRPREVLEIEREDFVISGNGSFRGTIEVPLIRGGEGRLHEVQVQVAVPSGPIEFSETATLVIDRMLQTIFMALVATTVAIPIAGVISFFAARNLMQPITLTVGSMLIAFISFAVGLLIGGQFLIPLGMFGIQLGRGAVGGDLGVLWAFLVPALITVAFVYALRALNPTTTESNQDTARWRQTANSVLVAVTMIFLIGALGGLGLLGGEQIIALGESIEPAEDTGNWFTIAAAVLIIALGNLLNILGDLIQLGMLPLAAGIVGFTLAGIAGNLISPIVRTVPDGLGRVLGLLLGVVSGGLLLTFTAILGAWASLLGLLPLVVGALLGGNLFLMILRRLLRAGQQDRILYQLNNRRIFRLTVFFAGAALVFLWMFDLLNVGRTLVDGTLPTITRATLFGTTLPISNYIFTAAWIGALLAGIAGLLSGVKGTFPLGELLYNTSRTLLNIVRSIEPLIMGLVFVVWVGIGPFAGVLALTLHSIAALGKLYSEQIENIDPGPIEALQSTGANQLQTIVYAVVPQIIPPYIAFTMYRWDINVRMSTIIGFVGGGGIGLLLQQQINLLRYRDAGVAVLAIAIVVSILDYASASIRERLT